MQPRRGRRRIGIEVRGRHTQQAQAARPRLARRSATARPARPAAGGPIWPGVSAEAANFGAIGWLRLRRQQLLHCRVGQAAQRLGASRSASRASAITGCARLHRPVQHRSGAYRRQQQHRRLRRQARPNSASPRGPAVSAASSTSGLSPVSSTGVPRRRSAAARCTVRRLRTVGSDADPAGPKLRRYGAHVSSQCTKYGTMPAHFGHDLR